MRLPAIEMSVSARLPPAVHSWLGRELEQRGIDAVVYTHYILSLLLEATDCYETDPLQSKRDARSRFPTKVRPAKTKGRRSDEEIRKSAAIECLLSVSESDEDCGIERLVDELYMKLKEQQETRVSASLPVSTHLDLGDSSGTESDDPAERYYAAFPALSKETENLATQPQPSEGTAWAKVAQRSLAQGDTQAKDTGEQALPHHAQDKENGSTVQHTPERVWDNGGRTISRTPGGAMRKEEQNKWSSRIIGYNQKSENKRHGPLSHTKDCNGNERSVHKHSHGRGGTNRSPTMPEWYDYPVVSSPAFVVPRVASTEMKLGYRVCEAEMFERLHHPRPHYKSVLRGKEWLARLMEMLKSQEGGRVEDQTWYTQPLEELLPALPSPAPSQRLYSRHTTTPEPGLEEGIQWNCMAEGGLAAYLHDLKEHLEEELRRQEAYTPTQEGGGTSLHGEELDGGECSCTPQPDTCDEDMDLCIQDLWNMSSPGSKDSTPSSSENEVLDDRPVFPPTLGFNIYSRDCVNNELPLLSVDTALAWVAPDGALPASRTHSLWACQHAPDTPAHAALWLPLLGCDNCQSNRRDSLARRSPVANPGLWASYLDMLVPALSASPRFSLHDLRLASTGYDRDSPWNPLRSTLPCSLSHLLSPKSDGGMTSQLWDVNMTSQMWDINLTSQIWDVNVHRRSWLETPHHDMCTALETIHRYLLDLNVESPFKRSQVFIKGGLYGSALCPEHGIWERNEEIQESIDGPQEEAEASWEQSRGLLCRQRSSSAEDISVDKTEDTSEILPSQNTAFTSSIPSRLPHVQSEPSLSLSNLLAPKEPTPSASTRLVQVRYLYKSDSSILTQLGLASEDASHPRPHLELSPDTHFRPIHTPNENRVGMEFNVKPTDDTPESLEYLIGCCSRYQLYLGEETEDMVRPCFVPKFRVEKDREKSIQTGENIKDAEEEVVEDGGEDVAGGEDYLQLCADPLEMLFTSDMQDELELSREDAEKLAMEDMHHYDFFSASPCDSPELAAPDVSLDELSGLQLSQLWNVEETESSQPAANTSGCSECTCVDIGITGAAQVWKMKHEAGCKVGQIWAANTTPVVEHRSVPEEAAAAAEQDGTSTSFYSPSLPGNCICAQGSGESLYTEEGAEAAMEDLLAEDCGPSADPIGSLPRSLQETVTPTGAEDPYLSDSSVASLAPLALSPVTEFPLDPPFTREYLAPCSSYSKPTSSTTTSAEYLPPGSSFTPVSGPAYCAEDNFPPCTVFSSDLHGAQQLATGYGSMQGASLARDPYQADTGYASDLIPKEGYMVPAQPEHAGTMLASAHSLGCLADPGFDNHLGADSTSSDYHLSESLPSSSSQHQAGTSTGHYRSIWSNGSDASFPPVPYVPDGCHGEEDYPIHIFPRYDSVDEDVFLEETCMPQWSTGAEEDVGGAAMASPTPKTHSSLDQSDGQSGDEDGGQSMMFSVDLEQLWLQDASDFEVQVPRKMQERSRTGSQQKPCSFFLEGHCRRSDCKFAHDVSCITCRFWEEGCCFKGLTCPFLHGYPTSDPPCPRPVPTSKEWKEFELKSEEFPELSKSQDCMGGNPGADGSTNQKGLPEDSSSLEALSRHTSCSPPSLASFCMFLEE